jgi:xylitol oxidase
MNQPNTPRTNWAGNYTFNTPNLYEPKTVEEAQSIVKNTLKLRALGARHSFNSIADSTEAQISLQHLDSISIDAVARTVTIGAGVTYGQLAPILHTRGFALHNLASLPHIGIVGACATATHGSGNTNGNLSTAVIAIHFISHDGALRTITRAQHPDIFPGAVVHLGSFGIVTAITLRLEPTYDIAQAVYQNLPFAQLEHHLEAIFSAAYSVSLFTDWQHGRATQAWLKHRVTPGTSTPIPPTFYEASLATENLHPLPGHSAENCTQQLGIPGPWHERLPHFRMDFTPSSGAELQTEYFVPRHLAYPAIRAVEQLRDRITPLLHVTELRTIAPDDLWLSPSYQCPALGIHFTWKPLWPEVRQLLPTIEAVLAPYEARPHWAKLNTIPGTRLAQLYSRMNDFKDLANTYDPTGKFRNEYIEASIFA